MKTPMRYMIIYIWNIFLYFKNKLLIKVSKQIQYLVKENKEYLESYYYYLDSKDDDDYYDDYYEGPEPDFCNDG